MSSNETSPSGGASTRRGGAPHRDASSLGASSDAIATAAVARLRVPVRIVSAIVAIGYIALSNNGMLDDLRVWAQMRPPAIVELSQYGVPRGKTTTITVDGQNLIDADAVLFDDARSSFSSAASWSALFSLTAQRGRSASSTRIRLPFLRP